MDCIFCKIVAGEIPNHTVYEDDHCLAFLDITPCVKGHTLIVPKVHAETILDLNDELAREFMLGVKRTTERVEAVLSPEGFNIGLNHHTAGGQAVQHLHVHVLPRWENDGGGNMHSIVRSDHQPEVAEVAKLFRASGR